MKVNWATSPGNQPKQDTSSKYTQFSDFRLYTEKKYLTSCVLPLTLYLLDLWDLHTNYTE